MKKPKPVLVPVKRGQQELRFTDTRGATFVLRLSPEGLSQPRILYLGGKDCTGMLLNPELAHALAMELLHYCNTGLVVPPPRKQEWLVCPRCGKKRYRERVRWVEDWAGEATRCHGHRCSACGFTASVYVMGRVKKAASKR